MRPAEATECARQTRVREAAARLAAGKLVAFPTETVYGLGADASNPAAVARIFAAKGRPADHPLIVHLPDAELLEDWASEVTSAARRLAACFWPGPLTLILPRAAKVPLEVTGGQNSVGLRVPAHPVALALLRTFGGGVAAPSANRFGRVSPTTADHVAEELGDAVDYILDGGPCQVGVESTILSLVGDAPRLLRPGGIPHSALEAALGAPVHAAGGDPGLRASGLLASHYAPAARLELCPSASLPGRWDALRAGGMRVAVMTLGALAGRDWPGEAMPGEAVAYARRLYAALRRLDGQDFDVVLVEAPPDTEDWQAVNDRLKRASHRET